MTLTYKQRLGIWWDMTETLFFMFPIFWFVCLGANEYGWLIGSSLLAGILIFVPPIFQQSSGSEKK